MMAAASGLAPDGVQAGRHRVPDPFGGADHPSSALPASRRGQQASHVVRVNVFPFLDVLCRDPDRIAIALDLAAARMDPIWRFVAEGNSAPCLDEPQVSPVALDTTEAVPSRELVQDGRDVVRRIE